MFVETENYLLIAKPNNVLASIYATAFTVLCKSYGFPAFFSSPRKEVTRFLADLMCAIVFITVFR